MRDRPGGKFDLAQAKPRGPRVAKARRHQLRDLLLYDSARRPRAEKPDVRERLAQEGPGALSDVELLAVLLGTGTRGKGVIRLAEEALERLDAENGMPGNAALASLSGLGRAKTAAISAALELGRRYYGLRERRIASPRDLWPLLAHYADRKRERFLCAALNGAHDLIALRVVSVGLVNRTVVHPREVFADPIVDRACAVIVAHNHPSSRLEPSPEDLDITRRLREAGRILGIELLDHLVFSSEGYLSFVERGLLEPPSTE